jgi:hypothetical protein
MQKTMAGRLIHAHFMAVKKRFMVRQVKWNLLAEAWFIDLPVLSGNGRQKNTR